MKIAQPISPHYRSKNIKHIKNHFNTLKLIIEKFPVDKLTPREIKNFVRRFKELLFFLHKEILRQHFDVKRSTHTKEYLKELFENMTGVIDLSENWCESKWIFVEYTNVFDDTPDVDLLVRLLIAKMSQIMALNRSRKIN